ncbi:MAG: hypothetical protein GF310_10285 [candidate division Zixibacteria bacterium]|nr:hypothetical protein [candidate division Zixibacteria bacterium]
MRETPTTGAIKFNKSPTGAMTFAPSRQLYDSETDLLDNWHETSIGRQIVYPGYYSSSCDYVLMNYPWRVTIGSTTIYSINMGMYDWDSGIWDYTFGGAIGTVDGPDATLHSNFEILPGDVNLAQSYTSVPGLFENSVAISGLTGPNCPLDFLDYTSDTLSGPPNNLNISTGATCGETNPYIYPKIDADTMSDGTDILHAATAEFVCPSGSGTVPRETISLLYNRKVGTNPWSEDPVFIDSAYLPSHIIRADENSSDVYYCYLRPLYWQSHDPNPCDPDQDSRKLYAQASEVVYRKSTDDGATWGPLIAITDYRSGFADGKTDPAIYDLSAMVDPDGNLHLVWPAADRQNPKDPDSPCDYFGAYLGLTGKLYHYDSGNDCISIAYDASKPSFWKVPDDQHGSIFPEGHWTLSKPNISWCDNKLYIMFQRFGANTDPSGDTTAEFGAGTPAQINHFYNADIFVVGSDASGGMGVVWSDAVNLTQTASDSCLPGDCFHESFPSMAMYSTDSLMLFYLEDKDPGKWFLSTGPTGSYPGGSKTENPLMFMTWPCFDLADAGINACLDVSPPGAEFAEIALAPNGNSSGCNTSSSYSSEVELINCGNIDLNFIATPNVSWLNVTFGTAGSIGAGAGPRHSGDPAWAGKSGCALPETIEWTANSSSLGEGNYTGTISVSLDAGDDFDISVDLIVACEYYQPEFANLSGGCWSVDVYNTPQSGSENMRPLQGNMAFFGCGEDSTLHPLYNSSLILGWKIGSDLFVYTDNSDDHMGDLLPISLPDYQRKDARMQPLSEITVTAVGDHGAGEGYWSAESYFCTPDSVVHGKAEFFVPIHEDTSVMIEKVTIWNESSSTLTDALIGEGIDWDVEKDYSFDAGGFDPSTGLIYQYGASAHSNVYAGMAPDAGHDVDYGGAVLDNHDWIYPDSGYNTVDIYNELTGLDGTYNIFSDSSTDLNSVFRFWEGSLAPNDTIIISKVKAVDISSSKTDLSGLQELIDKGFVFIDNNNILEDPQECVGICGDASNDGAVNVSDAVWVINYVFIGGAEPQPVLACGDANGEGAVNVSDAVWIINYVFIGGGPPGDCSPGSPNWYNGDCCPFDA